MGLSKRVDRWDYRPVAEGNATAESLMALEEEDQTPSVLLQLSCGVKSCFVKKLSHVAIRRNMVVNMLL